MRVLCIKASFERFTIEKEREKEALILGKRENDERERATPPLVPFMNLGLSQRRICEQTGTSRQVWAMNNIGPDVVVCLLTNFLRLPNNKDVPLACVYPLVLQRITSRFCVV